MNNPADSEQFKNPRALRVYLRAVAVLLPSLVALIYSNILLLPKLEHLWHQVDLDNSSVQWLFNLSRFCGDYFRVIIGVFVLLIAVLESKSAAWPRHRAVTVDILIVTIYTTVIVGLAAIATSTLLAAPLLSIKK